MINYRTIAYAITDKRVYVSGGIFGRDVNDIEHREIKNLSVNVNFLENLKKVGTINLISAAASYSTLSYSFAISRNKFIAIKDPYNVYKLLKKISLNVAIDQAYPNTFRPKENTGYNRKFKEK